MHMAGEDVSERMKPETDTKSCFAGTDVARRGANQCLRF